MTILQVLILCGVSFLVQWITSRKFKEWFLLIFNTLAVFWLQPELPIRWLDFWLSVASIGLTLGGWYATAPAEERKQRDPLISTAVVLGVVLILGMGGEVISQTGLRVPLSPPLHHLVLGLLLIAAMYLWMSRGKIPLKTSVTCLASAILLMFVILKQPWLSQQTAVIFRNLVGQNTSLATSWDIRWLGFSYIAFRILHTLRERILGRLPDVTLMEYYNYVLFFPALPAGPIDRIERFVKNLRAEETPSINRVMDGFERVLMGLVKKFVVADSLALISLNAANAYQVTSFTWRWVLVYAYALQIFFDFSGYTDIAIGMARWMGIRLPENFNRPYLKSNLSQFWNNWHITLTQWFRAYYFNPITRALKTSRVKYSPLAIILFGQVSTMVIIGLWHGMTWNFVAWGFWHGIGMFIQNRWSENSQRWTDWINKTKTGNLARIVSTVLTFHYVAMGWVWFALPDIGASFLVLKHLVGL